ncbi:FISUMP domain-containing protein [Bacteroidota bacterium]
MKNISIFILFILVICFKGISQSPQSLNYQAVARNIDGSVIAESQIGIKISIIESSSSGTVLYSETFNKTTNILGLFSLEIGRGESDDVFSAIDWSTPSSKWIRVEVDIEGGNNYILNGTSQLLSVPYSLYANQSGSSLTPLRSMTDAERDEIDNPVSGSVIFNSTTENINVFKSGSWWELTGERIIGEFTCGDSFVDERDSKEYPTVKIGNKCWMAKNLDVGTMINGSINQTNNDIIEKYCYNNDANNCNTYGALYQWDELMSYSKTPGVKGICPEGWHIPSDIEWQEMEISIGLTEIEAQRNNAWRGTDQGAQLGNGGSSGFNALYSGRRVVGGLYSAIGSYEYVWTSTEINEYAWRRCLNIVDPKIGRWNTFPKTYGMSVRCVKN